MGAFLPGSTCSDHADAEGDGDSRGRALYFSRESSRGGRGRVHAPASALWLERPNVSPRTVHDMVLRCSSVAAVLRLAGRGELDRNVVGRTIGARSTRRGWKRFGSRDRGVNGRAQAAAGKGTPSISACCSASVAIAQPCSKPSARSWGSRRSTCSSRRDLRSLGRRLSFTLRQYLAPSAVRSYWFNG